MKKFVTPLYTAWTAVATHKLRSFLTILGVVIGIAAVIILMSVGKGAEAQIMQSFQNLGANLITISPGFSSSGMIRGGFGSATTLTLEDAEAIEAEVKDIKSVAPSISTGMQVIAGKQNMFAMTEGITPAYLDINQIKIQEGSPITEYDVDRKLNVALLGPNVAETLFRISDPIGQRIRLGNNIFTVIGVLESKGTSFTPTDNAILIPLTTLQEIMGRTYLTINGDHIVSSIMVQALDEKSISPAKKHITYLLQERHKIAPGEDNDFMITSTDEIAESLRSSARSLTLLLGSIAGISLLVGGIGVMNIMLVSVVERRREIGIRKALGAKERDIWGQFLVDSALLTLTGGVIGIALGWGGSYLLGKYLSSVVGGMSTLVTTDVVILAAAVSIGIGLFFGFYPAWQGSRLDPIQALRSE